MGLLACVASTIGKGTKRSGGGGGGGIGRIIEERDWGGGKRGSLPTLLPSPPSSAFLSHSLSFCASVTHANKLH